ncbi:hypothetical protein [Chroococcidiopsis sp. CCMEE 29]|uniref:hypothetical protein n=1 Tax=Chroococcidiopsis sp. CCMEE 29 TaxID=155894 RepID=UPI002020BDCF|nr:hypothetical protein [Chroococcidiopsis sp. CCMEE 29]
MTPAEIEAALQTAFNRCDVDNCPLTEQQKQILLKVVEELMLNQLELLDSSNLELNSANPLGELTPEQRQRFLQFVKEQEQQNRPWKIKLLNDWLKEHDSGSVQFIRDQYGPQWLNQIKPIHIAEYAEEGEEALKLKVGDRIEVSNALWEWVQENGPCSREWVSCTVIQVEEIWDSQGVSTYCIIRFNNGAEYEIQGMYQWNRYNWRWPSK